MDGGRADAPQGQHCGFEWPLEHVGCLRAPPPFAIHGLFPSCLTGHMDLCFKGQWHASIPSEETSGGHSGFQANFFDGHWTSI